jgi:hypothetical protein
MTTRIHSAGPATDVARTSTASRVTPPPARPFKQVMQAGAIAVVSGAEAAVSKLPGGPILAAAVRPGPSVAGGAVGSASLRPEGSSGTAAPAGGQAGGEPGIENMLNQHADQNLYFLELQERISAESRAYSALSNVLKARHDTVKNAIGNIR